MRKSIYLLAAMLLLASLTACRSIRPSDASSADAAQTAPTEAQVADSAAVPESADTMTAYRADGTSVTLNDRGDGTWKDPNGTIYYRGEDGVWRARGAEDLYSDITDGTEAKPPATAAPIKRQDGDRFEAVIMIEGLEETVRYEHVRNDRLGFEIDYEYDWFVRESESVCERFVSMYDDADEPQNYLELSFNAEDADTVAASVCASLSDDYDVIREPYTLERAGSCIRIDASSTKGNGGTPDLLQMVYIIPASDGCLIASAHYSFESAEGFGRRISYMMDTLEVISRTIDPEDSAYEQPDEAAGEWTGRDFGELPPEDFEGWGDNGQDPEDNGEWTGRDFGELPPEDFEGWGDDGQAPEDNGEWTGRDFGELPPEDFYTGVDYGELPPEDFGE